VRNSRGRSKAGGDGGAPWLNRYPQQLHWSRFILKDFRPWRILSGADEKDEKGVTKRICCVLTIPLQP